MLTKVLITAAIFMGFINLLPVPAGNYFPAAIPINAIIIIMGFESIVALLRAPIEFWMAAAFGVLVIGMALAVGGPESLTQGFKSLRSLVLFTIVGIYISSTIRDIKAAVSIIDYTMKLGVIIAGFGCMQFAFRNVLPSWLLYSRDAPLFSYYGTDIVRSTGLVGNTIVFSTLLVLVYSLWLAKAAWKPSLKGFIPVAIVFTAVLTTFSRVQIFCMVVITLIIFAVALKRAGIFRSLSKSSKPRLVITLTSALVAVYAGSLVFRDTFLWRGLFKGQNASAVASAADHLHVRAVAFDILSNNPLLGLGLGTQSQSSDNAIDNFVITDGFHFATLAEGGLVLFISVAIFLVSITKRTVVAYSTTPTELKFIPLALCAYLFTQLAIAGFFNTGFYGKTPYLIMWVIYGAALVISRSSANMNNVKERTSHPPFRRLRTVASKFWKTADPPAKQKVGNSEES